MKKEIFSHSDRRLIALRLLTLNAMRETSPNYYENEDELDADTLRTLEAFDVPISSMSDVLPKDKQTEMSQQSCSNIGSGDNNGV